MAEAQSDHVVIIDFTVLADEFALGRIFETFPNIEVEIERIIPITSSIMPLFWVSGSDPNEVERELQTDPITQTVSRLTQVEERHLFEIDWDPAVDSLIQPLIRNDADVLRATGGPEEWEFRVQFRTREQVSAFREDCVSHDLHLNITRVYNPTVPEEAQLLTDTQRETLRITHEEGYWNVPRGTTLADLGDRLGISDSATSQRIRRGVGRLIEAYVLSDLDG